MMLLLSHAPLVLRWVVDMPESWKCRNFWEDRLSQQKYLHLLKSWFNPYWSLLVGLHIHISWQFDIIFISDGEKRSEQTSNSLWYMNFECRSKDFSPCRCENGRARTKGQILPQASDHQEGYSLLKGVLMQERLRILRILEEVGYWRGHNHKNKEQNKI